MGMNAQFASRRLGTAVGAALVAVSLVSAPIAPVVEVSAHRVASFTVELQTAVSDLGAVVAASATEAAATENSIGDVVKAVVVTVGIVVFIVLTAPISIPVLLVFGSIIASAASNEIGFPFRVKAPAVKVPDSVVASHRTAGGDNKAPRREVVRSGATANSTAKPSAERKVTANKSVRSGKAGGSSARVRSGK